MSLDKKFFEKETNINATVICDSISHGIRITTVEVEYPRFIHGELMTHRMLSKNSGSSRAIPIKTMSEQIKNNMAVPTYFGANKAGMQAGEEINFPELAKKMWISCGRCAIEDSLSLSQDFDLHKQISNRITEPYQMMKVLITATEWDNFFNLRIHADAQPEIAMLAYKIYIAMEDSVPLAIKSGEWHLPYVKREVDERGLKYFLSDGKEVSLDEAIKISASCSAQTSYRKNDESLTKATKIFDMLINAEVKHSSPFEHLATPIKETKLIENSDYETVGFVNFQQKSTSWESGLTHCDKSGNLWSGNLKGWISYRHKHVSNNTCTEFNFIERMNSFGEG